MDRHRYYLLSDCVAGNRRWHGGWTALIHEDRSWTWSEFADETELLQRGLAAHGVTRGSRVAVLDRNSADYVFLHYALAGMGAVLVPVNMWLRAAEIAYVLNEARPLLLVVSSEFRPLAGEAMQLLMDRPVVIHRGVDAAGDVPWQELRSRRTDAPLSRPAGWNDPHMVLFTSGTTGRPKGAVISHRRSVVDALSTIPIFNIQRSDRFFCYIPLFHTAAWDHLKLYFLQGASAVIAPRFDAEEAVSAIARHRCTTMFGVAMVLRAMVASAAWQLADVSAMRLIVYANFDPSGVMLHIAEQFRARGAAGIRISHAYGLTEAGPFVTILRPEDAFARPHSIGTPVPGVDVILLDDAGTEVRPGDIGEICLRAPSVMSGYLNRPEPTAEAFADGWLHSGDLGRVDDEGFLYIVDRKKAMIRTGAENVSAREVELVIGALPGVHDCAVIGMPDDDYGERVVAAVVMQPGATVIEADVIAEVRRQIAGFKAPRQVFLVDELPKTPAGKVQKHILKQLLANRAVSPRS